MSDTDPTAAPVRQHGRLVDVPRQPCKGVVLAEVGPIGRCIAWRRLSCSSIAHRSPELHAPTRCYDDPDIDQAQQIDIGDDIYERQRYEEDDTALVGT